MDFDDRKALGRIHARFWFICLRAKFFFDPLYLGVNRLELSFRLSLEIIDSRIYCPSTRLLPHLSGEEAPEEGPPILSRPAGGAEADQEPRK